MTALLGGLAPRTFLARHWQKRPLLVRQAVPGFRGLVDPRGFLALAERDDVTSRLIIEHPRRRGRGHWERHDGPFGALSADLLPASHWTLLVHGLESLVPGGWELLGQFDFIPRARIDDLMVSYAADGGSVGPHDDRYDVFLLQGPGRRRWQVSSKPHRVDPDAAIKVLADFVPEEEWLLEPGDMLYLPPGVAHFGVAEGECFTYSIGFLAPSHVELVQSFLGYLQHTLPAGMDADALYEDPDLRPARDDLEVPDAMLARVTRVLEGAVRWDRGVAADFLGCFLTRPRAHARFAPPRRPLDEDTFARRVRGARVTLALPTRGLTRGDRVFVNGEAHRVSRATRDLVARLVRERSLTVPARGAGGEATALLHGWYVAGWLRLGAGR